MTFYLLFLGQLWDAFLRRLINNQGNDKKSISLAKILIKIKNEYTKFVKMYLNVYSIPIRFTK